jgi:acetolactate synthase-1/2/3 large subunit
MAEAVGKITGRPGICFVTRGPGATNASAGIHIARQDSSPMIVFVGQVGREMREREAFQELDYRAVFGTMAKWATEIDDPSRIPEIVSRAFHTACNGRPGPVVIALPEDMLRERVSVPDATAFTPVEISPGKDEMNRLQELFAESKRPVALIGGSRWTENATAALMSFAERFSLPVATTFRRGHLFDATHPCYAGDFGIGPNPKLLARVKNSDLLLLIGGRFSEMPSQNSAEFITRILQSMPLRPRFAPRCRIYNRRSRSLGAASQIRHTPTISPGARRRRRCRAPSISAKSWSGCAKACLRTQS